MMSTRTRTRDKTTSAAPTNARRITQFIIAGGIGFGVDAAILMALTEFAGWPPMRARVVSFIGAVSVTWLLNRYLAFADRRALQAATSASEYARYVLTQSMGAAVNLAVFALALWSLPELRAHLLVPLALGSACALCCNYIAMHYLVFPHRASM